MSTRRYPCPSCGAMVLHEPSYGEAGEPSYEVCPRCGFEPGFDEQPSKEKPPAEDSAEG